MAITNRWPLTSAFGARDVVGGIDLTNNGAVTFSDDGASFNGTNQWLSGTKTLPAAFSMSVWAVSTVSGGAMIGTCNTAAPYGQTNIFTVNTDLRGQLCGSGQYMNAVGMWTASSTPRLIVYTKTSGGACTLYLGNSAVATGTYATETQSPNFAIGRNGTNNSGYLTGKILDARIYDHALAPGEITALASRGPWPYLQVPNDGAYYGTVTRVPIPDISRRHSSYGFGG